MDISTQVGVAALVSLGIQWAKQSSWFPWLTTETDKLNRGAAVALSGLASIGIHVSHPAAGSWLVEGVTIATIAPALWHWFIQFLYTHGIYKSGEVLPLLRKLNAALQLLAESQAAKGVSQ